MFYVLSKLLDILLSPLTWALLLLLAGAPLSRRALSRKKGLRRARPWMCVLGIAILYAFSIDPVANSLFGHLESLAVNTEKKDVTYDAVVLLGGLVEDRAMMKSRQHSYNDNVERLLATWDVYREGRARFIVVSGGATAGTPDDLIEANVLADQLVQWGVPRDKIVIDAKALNTRENAVNVAAIARARGWSRILMVTSAFHMRRAYACFTKAQLPVDTLPVDYRAWSPNMLAGSWLPRTTQLDHATAAIRELSGYYIYRFQGYAD